MRRRRRNNYQVSTFPFLAVMLCAMGSLILLLLILDRRAKIAERNKVQAAQAVKEQQTEDEDAARRRYLEQLREFEERRRALHELFARQQQELLERIAALRERSGQTGQDLARAQALNDKTRAQLEAEGKRLNALRAAIHKRQQALQQSSQATDSTRDELARLAAELQELENTIAELKILKKRQKTLYSVVPYSGRQGDDRKPVYLECTADSVILHPERTLLYSPIEVRAQVLRRVVMRSDKGYVLLLVRPDGIYTYSRVIDALDGLDIEFGYEFVEQDWALDFPKEGEEPSTPQPWKAANPGLGSGRGGNGVGDGGNGRGGNGNSIGGTGRPTALPFGQDSRQANATGNGNGTGFGPPGTGAGNGLGNPGGGAGSRPGGAGTGNGHEPGGTGTGHGLGKPGDGSGTGNGIHPGGTRAGNGFHPGNGSGTGNSIHPGGTGAGSSPHRGGTGNGPGTGVRPGGTANGTGSSPRPGGSGTGNSAQEGPGFGSGNAASGSTGSATGAVRDGGTTGNSNVGGGSGEGGNSAARPGGSASTGNDSGAGNNPGMNTGAATGLAPPRQFPLNRFGRSSVGPDAGDENADPTQPGRGSQTGGTPTSDPSGQPGSGAVVEPGQQPPRRGGLKPNAEPPPILRRPNSGGGQGGDGIPGGGTADEPAKPKPPIQHLDREWFIPIECTAEGVMVHNTGQRFTLAELMQRVDNPLTLAVSKLIERRQKTVPEGAPPWQPHIRFLVTGPGLRAYYLAYPRLQDLGVPMVRVNTDRR